MILPYGRQSIDDADVEAVTKALRSDLLTTGPLVNAYETALCSSVGATYVVSCNSGTAALHLAMLALGIGPGDVVIVPTITFVATANVVRMCGGTVVFADVDPDSGLVTPGTMKEALERATANGKVRAAFAVHLNGQLCDIAGLKACLDPDGIELVEDAAHALGAKYRWDGGGTRLACFSTHPVKTIATGEGGFVATCDAELADRMRLLRAHGITRDATAFTSGSIAFDGSVPNPWHYEMPFVGFNYRLPDVLCALGLSQLRKLNRFIARRLAIARIYDDAVRSMAPTVMPVPRGDRPDGLHLYPLLIDFKALRLSRRAVMESLRMQGVGTQVHYIPVHLQPYYKASVGTPELPGAMAYFERCLSIPFFPDLSDGQVAVVVRAMNEIFSQRN